MSDTATIGHNMPPATPFETIKAKINDLYEEAKQWLDGDPIITEGQAKAVNALIVMIRDAEKEADELRKAEAAPYDEAKAEIQARYNTLIGNTKSGKGYTVLAIEAAKKALTPWLTAQDEIKRAAERKAREEAERAQLAAQEAFRNARESESLVARQIAEEAAAAAKHAEIAARVAENDTAKAKGGAGRATSLRSYYSAEITDATMFARYVWVSHADEMRSFLLSIATRLVAANHDKPIPGVKIIEDRRAV